VNVHSNKHIHKCNGMHAKFCGVSPYVTYVVAFKPMSPMWWCEVTYVVDAVTYVTYVVVRVPMSRIWWRLNLCHLCGGVRSSMWWR